MDIPREIVYKIIDLLKTHDDESAEDIVFSLQELTALVDE